MKHIISSIAILLTFSGSAQDRPGYIAHFKCSIDYLKNHSTNNFNGTLIFDNSGSYYFQVKNPDFSLNKDQMTNVVRSGRPDTSYKVFTEQSQKMLLFSDEDAFSDSFTKTISDSLGAIRWHIIDGDSSIAGYYCKKAKADFRGRSYHAWFSPDIPVTSGPWKFGGLPGLILKVGDIAGEICWEIKDLKASNISFPEQPQVYMDYVPYKQKVDAKLQRIKKAMQSPDNTDINCKTCKPAEFRVYSIENNLSN